MAKKKITAKDLEISKIDFKPCNEIEPPELRANTTRNTCSINTGCDGTTTDPTNNGCETREDKDCQPTYNCPTKSGCSTYNKCPESNVVCNPLTKAINCKETVNFCISVATCGNSNDICLDSEYICQQTVQCETFDNNCGPASSVTCIYTEQVCPSTRVICDTEV